MRSVINELWHGNIIPQEDSRNNSKEMKELIEISMNNCIPYRLTHPYRFLIIYLKMRHYIISSKNAFAA